MVCKSLFCHPHARPALVQAWPTFLMLNTSPCLASLIPISWAPNCWQVVWGAFWHPQSIRVKPKSGSWCLPWAWQQPAVLWPRSSCRRPRLPERKAEVKLDCRCDWLSPFGEEDFVVANPSGMVARWNYIKKSLSSEVNIALGTKKTAWVRLVARHSFHFYNGSQ